MDRLNGVNCRYLGNIMFQEGLDAILQRRGRGWTAGAGALHLQIHIALVETAIDDVAAVVGDRGADARFDQLLDLFDDVSSEERRVGKECVIRGRSRWWP